jgi:acetyltransferase
VTNSGGPGVLAADRAEEVDLQVVEPSPALRERLTAILPAHCALENPIDLTVQGTEEEYRRTLSAVLEEVDLALAINVATPYLDSQALARGVCHAARGSDKPVVAAFLPETIVAQSVDTLQRNGVPNFATGERAVTALARLADYDEWARQRARPDRPEPVSEREGDQLVALPLNRTVGLEPEAMAWLRENDIPVPRFRFAPSRERALQACRELGYPVAMKVVSPQILHKSDVGGVILDVDGDEMAAAAFEALEEVAAGKEFRGTVIYPMMSDALEVLLGLSRDPQFGPVIAFGLGGIYTEVWHDVALRVAPVDETEARALMREIASFPLLEGVRGQGPRDLDALVDVLVRVSQLPFRYPQIGEVDLNPVFLFREGEGLLVGDARVIERGRARS